MERHGGDLERKTRDKENEANQQTNADFRLPACEGIAQYIEICRAGEAVNQGGAIEQHARGQGTENKILQAGLRRADAVAFEGSCYIEGQAHQLNPEIHGHEIIGRDHDHHAERGNHDQDRKLEPDQLFALVEINRHDDGESGRA